MKNSLLLAVGMVISCATVAQSTYPKVPLSNSIAAPHNKVMKVGDEPLLNPGSSSRSRVSLNGRTIGTTSYDLQTNSSSQNRLVLHPDGTVSAVWTYSNDFTLAAPDRGTGYNYHDGTSWMADPTSRIESERGGWPSILSVNGGEFNSLHNTTSNVITTNRRSTKGSGNWTEANNVSNLDLIWNRTAVGGPNGNTIHMIAVTAPEANDGAIYQGLDGALLYYRSQDGGATWDIQDSILPGLTATDYVGFTGDGYSITARGNTVAIVYFGEWSDAVLMKSTDNGDTWTKSIINEFPIDLWDDSILSDIDGDGVADTLFTTDGAGSVVLDTNDNAHVFFGLMRVLEADLGTEGSSYFPYTNALLYWNESFGPGASSTDFADMSVQIIAQAEDLDDDGAVANANESDIALYFVSLAGIPTVTYDDATGRMFVAYQSYMETLSNGSQSYRHIYVTNSVDGGATWTTPIDFTNNGPGFEECVFPSAANAVDDTLRIIYQEDNEPGLAVRGDEDSYSSNDIVYLAIPIADLPGLFTNDVTISNGTGVACEGEDITLTAVSTGAGYSYAWSSGQSTREIVLNTPSQTGTYTVTITDGGGAQQISNPISVTINPNPSAPTVTDNGDGTLTANSSSATSYQWFVNGSAATGETSDTYDASGNPGDNITVNVTDANGCTSAQSSPVTGIDNVHPVIGAVAVYPNPAQGQVQVSFTGTLAGEYNIDVINAVGQVVLSNQVMIDQTQIVPLNINALGAGVYQIRISNGSDQLVQPLMVK